MMKLWLALVLLLPTAAALDAQGRGGSRGQGTDPLGANRGIGNRMPDGRSRTLLILKNDVEKSSKEMARVVELATQLQQEIEENKFHTVDLGSVRKAEEIIRLVRKVKGRLSKSQ